MTNVMKLSQKEPSCKTYQKSPCVYSNFIFMTDEFTERRHTEGMHFKCEQCDEILT